MVVTAVEYLVPMVMEKSGRAERAFDIWSRLLRDRIIFIGVPIDDYISNLIIAQLLFLQMENKSQEISLYVNCPGGSVTAGLAVYDTMQFITCDVATYCVGQAASMAALLLCGGAKGKRFALPHSRIMLHQPWGGAHGVATDIKIHAEEILRLKKKLNEIFAKHTGQSVEKIEGDAERDFFMSSAEAVRYGLVDEVLETLKAKSQPGKEQAPKQ